MKKYIDEFLQYCRVEKNYSENTLIAYEHQLNYFNDWLTEYYGEVAPRKFNTTQLRAFRNHLAGTGRKQTTQFYFMVALRSFLHFLAKNNINTVKAEQVELGKIRDRDIKFLVPEQVEQLMLAPSLETVVGMRDRAMLELLFSTGLRVSELASLKVSQLDFLNRSFTIIGKGGKSRLVFLSENAVKYIKLYQRNREDVDNDVLFPISVRHIQRQIEKYGRQLKLPFKLSPHVLRHSFGTDLLRNGADLRSVQELLGHKNLNTTQLYTHITDNELQNTYNKFHGRRG